MFHINYQGKKKLLTSDQTEFSLEILHPDPQDEHLFKNTFHPPAILPLTPSETIHTRS